MHELQTDTFKISALEELANRVGVDPENTKKVRLLFQTIETEKLKMFCELFDSKSFSAAFLELECYLSSVKFSEEQKRVCYLLISLLQIPHSIQKRKLNCIPEEVSWKTLSDMGIRQKDYFQKSQGSLGIPDTLFSWFQSYLSHNLFRVGHMQFELISFPYDFFLIWDGQQTIRESYSDSRQILIKKGDPILKMHLPLGGNLDPKILSSSMQEALTCVEQWGFQKHVKGFLGEGWFLDEKITPLIKNKGLQFISKLGPHYPCQSISEVKTLKRIFGPNEDRMSILKMTETHMSSLEKFIKKNLENPNFTLEARGVLCARDYINGEN